MNVRNVIRLQMGNKLGFGSGNKNIQKNNFNQQDSVNTNNLNYQSDFMQ